MVRLCWLTGLALAGLVLAGCDAVRYPGDGGEPPRTPVSRDPDAPPPPPPTQPVLDPYGTGQGNEPDAEVPAAELPAEPPAEPVETSAPGVDDPAAPEPTAPQPVVSVQEPVFSYFGPGQLLAGSGTGAPSQIVHAPDMVFPIRSAPAYLQSMVWTFGGGIGGGDECDTRNFAYPWRDNFCETRTANRGSPHCPVNKIHQGQDIRVGTPPECLALRATPAVDRMLHEVVAVEDGVIYEIGSFTVKLRAGGRIYRYLHLNMAALQVAEGDSVQAGDVIGYVSKDFGGTPTVFHLHFEIMQNSADQGWVFVPPYLSLVAAYERREQGPGERLETNVATASAPVFPPEGMEIIE